MDRCRDASQKLGLQGVGGQNVGSRGEGGWRGKHPYCQQSVIGREVN